MDYAAWRQRREQTRSAVLELVRVVEAGRADAAALAAAHPEFGFSPRVWDACLALTEHLRGVKRIDGFPYATHPTRMALACHWVLAGEAAASAAVVAFLHDYLEEGGGVTRAGLAALRMRLPGEPVEAAVLLTEPDISYEQLGRASERSMLRRVAYVVQAEDALAGGAPQAFADAALADKLDNLHDLGYLQKEPDPARRRVKLAQRAAFFAMVAERLGPYASREMRELIAAALPAQVAEMGLGEVVGEQLEKLETLRVDRGNEIRKMIAVFHPLVL